MVRKSAVIFAIGGALLVLLTWGFVAMGEQIPVSVRRSVVMTIPLIVLFGMIVGWGFARDWYFGKILVLNLIDEGEYTCYTISDRIFSLRPMANTADRRFLWVDPRPETNQIPVGIEFTLNVGTETGKEICPDDKKQEKFTRRIFKARWKDEKANEFRTTQWDIEV